jgi:hypothetical protein
MVHAYNVTHRSCIERTEGVRAVPNLMPAFQALDRAHTGYVDRQRFALALRKVCICITSLYHHSTHCSLQVLIMVLLLWADVVVVEC